MTPFFFAVNFSIFFTLGFVIFSLFLFSRWFSIFTTDYCSIRHSNMKVPTFYSTNHKRQDEGETVYIPMSVVGVVFGGIHCAGWFFTFPSSAEAMLWRVCSAILAGTAFLLPLLIYFIMQVKIKSGRWLILFFAFLPIILLVYVVSRLLLLVEAFISLRFLTPGMLALVKWTSFIPHI